MDLGKTVNTNSHNTLYTNLLYPWSVWSVVSTLYSYMLCYYWAVACKSVDHPCSVATTYVTLNMKNENLNPFDLNRKEYAELLGISPNAVRMKQRRGKLEENINLKMVVIFSELLKEPVQTMVRPLVI